MVFTLTDEFPSAIGGADDDDVPLDGSGRTVGIDCADNDSSAALAVFLIIFSVYNDR